MILKWNTFFPFINWYFQIPYPKSVPRSLKPYFKIEKKSNKKSTSKIINSRKIDQKIIIKIKIWVENKKKIEKIEKKNDTDQE